MHLTWYLLLPRELSGVMCESFHVEPKASYLGRPFKYLHIPGEVPISRRYLLELHCCSWATGIQDDLVGQWSKSNHNTGIFTHPGVRTPPTIAEAQRLLNMPDPSQAQDGVDNITSVEGLQPGLMSQLPFVIIF
jgi:hypothetical protein